MHAIMSKIFVFFDTLYKIIAEGKAMSIHRST